MKIIIDPRSSFAYGSYYLYAMRSVLKDATISFGTRPFRALGDIGWNMRFVAREGETERKYFIHAHDAYDIIKSDYEWCDVYGCVNTNYAHYPQKDYPKLVCLCPSFSVVPDTKWWCYLTIMRMFIPAIPQLLKRRDWNSSLQRFEVNAYRNVRHFFSRSLKTLSIREFYSQYTPQDSTDNYIFFLSTLWTSNADNKNDEGVNLRRANFIRACKSVANRGGRHSKEASPIEVTQTLHVYLLIVWEILSQCKIGWKRHINRRWSLIPPRFGIVMAGS